jgi:phosphopantothenoylcysteine decarboxylase/phosphopantothenate--cysteine ligase
LKYVSDNFSESYIVGFAAETSDVIENAKKKLLTKNLDMIISNDISDKSIGFDVDENEVNVITKDETLLLKKDKKIRIARQILKIISENINK